MRAAIAAAGTMHTTLTEQVGQFEHAGGHRGSATRWTGHKSPPRGDPRGRLDRRRWRSSGHAGKVLGAARDDFT
jgi:hypothetical protein